MADELGLRPKAGLDLTAQTRPMRPQIHRFARCLRRRCALRLIHSPQALRALWPAWDCWPATCASATRRDRQRACGRWAIQKSQHRRGGQTAHHGPGQREVAQLENSAGAQRQRNQADNGGDGDHQNGAKTFTAAQEDGAGSRHALPAEVVDVVEHHDAIADDNAQEDRFSSRLMQGSLFMKVRTR